MRLTDCAKGTADEPSELISVSLGVLQPFRYRGYVYDDEIELYYLKSRNYKPEWYKFIKADMLISGNLYCYCYNNPAIMFDSDGTNPLLLTDVMHDKKRYRHSWSKEGERLTATVFAETLISIQKSNEWVYGKTINCQYRSVDCVGLYRYIMLWYYTRQDYNQFLGVKKKNGTLKKNKNGSIVISNQVSQLVDNNITGLMPFDRNGDCGELQIGMAVLKYDASKVNEDSKGWEHIGYYVGETEDGPHTVIEATESGKLVAICQIENTGFNFYGYLGGISY